MASIYQVVQQQRRQQRARDAYALTAVAKAYALARQDINRQIAALLLEMAADPAADSIRAAEYLSRAGRLAKLRRMAADRIGQFATYINKDLIIRQRAEVEQAERDAGQIVEIGQRINPAIRMPFNRLPIESVETIVGSLSDQSPLRRLIRQMPADAADAVETLLIQGIATGRNPRETARRMAQSMATGGMLPAGTPTEAEQGFRAIKTRALAISRTETLRAYRSASIDNYNLNRDIVTGWVWVASLSLRTCAACWAMHGTVHELSEVFGSHVNCRCSPAPILRGVDMAITPGEDAFGRLEAREQSHILGAGKYELFKSGQIALSDAVHYSKSRDWGPQRAESTIAQALASAAARG